MSRMAQPWKHPKTGVYWYRRAVPKTLRERLDRGEWLRTLGTKDLTEAKRRYPAVAAECESAFEAARNGTKLTAATLSPRQIASLGGEWLRRELAAHEGNRHDAAHWHGWLDDIQRKAERKGAPTRSGQDTPLDARGMVGAVAEDVEQLLADEGLALSHDSKQFHDLSIALFWHRITFCNIQLRHLGGDWSAPSELDKVPPWKRAAASSKTLTWAFEEWVKARKPKPRSEYEFRRYIAEFGNERLVEEITADDVRAFRDRLVAANTTGNYVDKKLTPIRSVMKWLVKEQHIASSPAVGIGVASLKHERQRKKRDGYTRTEAKTLLAAARKEKGALRWLPWVLAATGCRLNEVCQAFAADVAKEDGTWRLNVTDAADGQSLKTETSRRKVPLHPKLVAEGFVKYVASLPKGSRLFPEATPNKVGNWGAKLGQKYGRWLRTMIADPRKVAHSWRHSFKTWAREADIGEEKSDALTGHQAPGRVGRDYGDLPLKTLAKAVAKMDFGAPPPLKRA